MHNLVQYVWKVPQVFETAQIGTEGSEESLRTALFSEKNGEICIQKCPSITLMALIMFCNVVPN